MNNFLIHFKNSNEQLINDLFANGSFHIVDDSNLKFFDKETNNIVCLVRNPIHVVYETLLNENALNDKVRLLMTCYQYRTFVNKWITKGKATYVMNIDALQNDPRSSLESLKDHYLFNFDTDEILSVLNTKILDLETTHSKKRQNFIKEHGNDILKEVYTKNTKQYFEGTDLLIKIEH